MLWTANVERDERPPCGLRRVLKESFSRREGTSEQIRCFAVTKWEFGGREIKVSPVRLPIPASIWSIG